jgi:hypothetical protein
MREILISVDLFINIKRLYIIGEVMHYSSASGNFFLYRIQRIQKKIHLTLVFESESQMRLIKGVTHYQDHVVNT